MTLGADSYDDESAAHTLQGRGDGAASSQHDRTHGSTATHLDPCTSRACVEACQAMSSVEEHMTMCGGAWGGVGLGYFKRDDGAGGMVDDPHASPYLYNPSAPIGPTSCEYCGGRNIKDCTSNLPEDYVLFMNNGLDRGRSNLKNSMVCDGGGADDCSGTISNDSNTKHNICPRPKLFFLKKRPPFATPDGWNPVTEYRTNLFEPPSSAGGGWGEVRGQLGGNAHASGTGNNMNRSYAASGCGSSACGGGAETEISFSSAGGGERGANVTSDAGRSLSPVQWVSGLMGALSPS